MRFRLGHPDYPSLDSYLTTPTPAVRAEVDRLGPLKIIASAYDWPRNEYPYHGWTDQLNQLIWPRDADQFASCFLLLDDARAELVKAITSLQFIKQGQPSSSSLSSIQGDIDAANGILSSAEAGDTVSSLVSANTGLRAALVEASASALSAFAENFSADSIAALEAEFATTVSSIASLSSITASNEAPRPYLILRAMLSPAEAARAQEVYTPAGMTLADVSATAETELMAWKLYPLPPVRLPDPDGSDPFPGLWLLPLVDIRYFWRLGPIGSDRGEGSSSSGDTVDPASSFPVSNVDPREEADWMPPLVTYPVDTTTPGNFVPIIDNGTNPAISSVDSRGWAADMQARMQNWRVVCRDVRTLWNNRITPHPEFTGIVCDYPDDPDVLTSYHLDAIRLASVTGNLIDGGLTDTDEIRNLVPRKIRVLFRIVNQTATYEVDVYPTVDDPQTVDDLAIDTNGPSDAEILHLPKVVLGVICGSDNPDDDTKNDLYTAAKQWVILYYLWRKRQCYFKFPGIAPVIPNGYGGMIVWDFASDTFSTTYVAADYLEGTSEAGFGEGSSAASPSDTQDNTAFVLVVNDSPIEGRWPVVRMDQEGLPRDWGDLEPAWAFNVIETIDLKSGEKYLCHRNVDQFLGLDQWATRDCCAFGSIGPNPEGGNCGVGCCGAGQKTIDISIQPNDSACNPCLPMTVTLYCDDRFGHWYGSGTCTSGGCTVTVIATMQCISCSRPPTHKDCAVDCRRSPYYYCLNWQVICSGTCGVSNTTGHKSWPASEVTCSPFSLPGFNAVICGCSTFWCIGVCNSGRCLPCSCVTSTSLFQTGVSRVINVTWNLTSPPVISDDACPTAGLPHSFYLIWNGADKWFGATSFTLTMPAPAGAADCHIVMQIRKSVGICNYYLDYTITVTPDTCGGLGGMGWFSGGTGTVVGALMGSYTTSCCPFVATVPLPISPGCNCMGTGSFSFNGI